MKIKLTKETAIDLLISTEPGFEEMSDLMNLKLGSYNGSYGTWSWHTGSLMSLNKKQIFNMYLKIKGKQDEKTNNTINDIFELFRTSSSKQ